MRSRLVIFLRSAAAAAALAAASPLALAHAVHGAEGPHTHASDAWGFVVAAALAAALAVARRK